MSYLSDDGESVSTHHTEGTSTYGGSVGGGSRARSERDVRPKVVGKPRFKKKQVTCRKTALYEPIMERPLTKIVAPPGGASVVLLGTDASVSTKSTAAEAQAATIEKAASVEPLPTAGSVKPRTVSRKFAAPHAAESIQLADGTKEVVMSTTTADALQSVTKSDPSTPATAAGVSADAERSRGLKKIPHKASVVFSEPKLEAVKPSKKMTEAPASTFMLGDGTTVDTLKSTSQLAMEKGAAKIAAEPPAAPSPARTRRKKFVAPPPSPFTLKLDELDPKQSKPEPLAPSGATWNPVSTISRPHGRSRVAGHAAAQTSVNFGSKTFFKTTAEASYGADKVAEAQREKAKRTMVRINHDRRGDSDVFNRRPADDTKVQPRRGRAHVHVTKSAEARAVSPSGKRVPPGGESSVALHGGVQVVVPSRRLNMTAKAAQSSFRLDPAHRPTMTERPPSRGKARVKGRGNESSIKLG